MYIRKRGKRFQCLIRFKGARLAKSFRLKQNAERWGHKAIAELDAGTYVDRDKQNVKEVIRKAHKKDSEIKLVKAPTYFPTNERMPETPPPNFETPIDLDLSKGLGSFLVTTRKDHQKY